VLEHLDHQVSLEHLDQQVLLEHLVLLDHLVLQELQAHPA